MTIGLVLLIITGVLVLFGVGQRVLDKLRLTDRQALLFIALIIAGGFIPDIPVTPQFSFNIGGALIPLALKGVKYREVSAGKLLSRNLLVYGLGGLAAPFIFIKLIDVLLTLTGLV